MTQKTWLITGSGNGLGRNIAEAALRAGENVVTGARRTEELASLVAQYGERVKPVTLEAMCPEGRDHTGEELDVCPAIAAVWRTQQAARSRPYCQWCC